MTQEEENETMKTKVFTLQIPRMNIEVFKVTKISSIQSLQENQSLQPKTFIFRGKLSL